MPNPGENSKGQQASRISDFGNDSSSNPYVDNSPQPTPPQPVELPPAPPSSYTPQDAGAGPQTPQSVGLNLGQAALSGHETTVPIFKQGTIVKPTDTGVEVDRAPSMSLVPDQAKPSGKTYSSVDEYLNSSEGKDALFNYAKTNADNNLIAFDNKLIDYHNNLAMQQNQSIALGNGLADLSNQQQIAKQQQIALGNGLIDLSNQQSQAKAEEQLHKIVSQGIIGNATEFDIYNKSGAKVGSIPANANSYDSLKTLLDTGEPLSIRAANPLAEQKARDESLSNLASLKSYIAQAHDDNVKSMTLLGPSKIGGAFESQGTKIGTTTPENALRDILGYGAKGQSVGLSYQPVAKPASGPFEDIKNTIKGSPANEFLSGTYAGVLAMNAKAPIIQPFTGLPSTVKEGSANVLSSVSSFGTKTYQPPTVDTSFFNENLLKKNPQYVTGGLAAAVGIGALTLGVPGAGRGISIASELIRTGIVKSSVSDIASGLAKGETTIAPRIEKVSSDLYHITQGTEGRSITPTQKFTSALNIFRLPTSKIVPGFGKVATEEGKVGASEIGIPKITKEIGNVQGEAEITQAFVQTGKNGLVAYIPKTISTSVKETSVLIENANPEIIKSLNLKPVETMPGFSSGKLTPESRLILQQAEENGFVTKISQAFQFPKSDVLKAVDVYPAIVKNPSLLGEIGTAATERLFPDITRPDIVALYRSESKGFGSAKGKVSYQGEPYGSRGEDALIKYLSGNSNKPIKNPLTGEIETIRGFSNEENKPRNQKKFTPFSFEKDLKGFTVGAGSSGKAKALTKEITAEKAFKDFFKSEVQKEKNIGDYLGFTTRTRGRTNTIQETEVIAYPPRTKSELLGKQGVRLSNDIFQNTKEKQSQAERSSTLFKLNSQLKKSQSERNVFDVINITGQKELQQTRQSLELKIGTLLQPKQRQDLITQRLLTNSFSIQKEVPIQTQKFRQSQIQLLEQVPLLKQVPKINIPKIPNITPTFGFPGGKPFRLGGYFGSGGFGGKKTKKKYELTYESTDINVKYLEGTDFLKESSNPKIFAANDKINRKAIAEYNRLQGYNSLGDTLSLFGTTKTRRRKSKR